MLSQGTLTQRLFSQRKLAQRNGEDRRLISSYSIRILQKKCELLF